MSSELLTREVLRRIVDASDVILAHYDSLMNVEFVEAWEDFSDLLDMYSKQLYVMEPAFNRLGRISVHGVSEERRETAAEMYELLREAHDSDGVVQLWSVRGRNGQAPTSKDALKSEFSRWLREGKRVSVFAQDGALTNELLRVGRKFEREQLRRNRFQLIYIGGTLTIHGTISSVDSWWSH